MAITREQAMAELARREMARRQAAQQEQAAPAVGAQAEMAAEEPGFGDQALGALENVGAFVSGLVAEPLAGFAGIAGTLLPGQEGQGAEWVEATREALTYDPQTQAGQEQQQAIGETLAPVGEALQSVEEGLGDATLQATGSPFLAALAHSAPTATMELLGFKGAGKLKPGQAAVEKSARKYATKEQAKKAGIEEVNKVKAMEEATGIRLMTSDVIPPETRAGKLATQAAEIGSGVYRKGQAKARDAALEDLMSKYDVTEALEVEADIFQRMKNSVDDELKNLETEFEQSTGVLAGMGGVEMPETRKLVSQMLVAENKKGSLARSKVIEELSPYLELQSDLDFQTIKNVRQSVGDALGKIRKGQDPIGSLDEPMYKALYSKLTKDMENFAFSKDKTVAQRWKKADSAFEELARPINKTKMRDVLRKGDVTPEVVDRLLFSPNKSDQRLLAKHLDEDGRHMAKQQILKRAAMKSRFFEEPNPNKFATEMRRLEKQIDVYFSPNEKKALNGLKKMLNDTRRAQDFAVTTPTGQQVLALASLTQPAITFSLASAGLIGESKAVRNLLIKRNAAKSQKQVMEVTQELMQEIEQLMIRKRQGMGAVAAPAAAAQLPQEDQTQQDMGGQ